MANRALELGQVLATNFARGMQMGQQSAREKQLREKQQRDKEALAKFLKSGKLVDLADTDPAVQLQARQTRAVQEAKAAEMRAAKETKLEAQRMKSIENVSKFIKASGNNPAAIERGAAYLRRQGLNAEEILGLPPQMAPGMQGPPSPGPTPEEAQASLQLYGAPDLGAEAQAPTALFGPRTFEWLQNQDETTRRNYMAAAREMQRLKAPVSNIVMPGNQEAVMAEKIKTQEILRNAEVTLEDIKDVESLGDPSEFLTVGGRAATAWRTGKSYLGIDMGEEDKNKLDKASKLYRKVEQGFLARRKIVTGVAGAEKEMNAIRDAMLNAGLDPVRFKSAFRDYKAATIRNANIARKILREGVDLTPQQYQQQFHDEWIKARENERNGGKGDSMEEARRLYENPATRAEGEAMARRLAAQQGGQ